MGGFMKAMGGGSYEGGDASNTAGDQRSGLHITTGGSSTSDGGGSNQSLIWIAAIAGFAYVIAQIAK